MSGSSNLGSTNGNLQKDNITDEADDIMHDRIALARSVSDHSLRVIGFIDTKTSIIVAIDGVLLGLLFGSVTNDLVPKEPWVQYTFIFALFFLSASAVSGLITIIPNVARNKRYSEPDSLMFHEIILGRRPYVDFRHRVTDWWGSKVASNPRVDAYQKFKKSIGIQKDADILKQEILDAYRLAEGLGHQYRWVRPSLGSLIVAVILLSIVLSVQMFNQMVIKSMSEECAENPKQFGVNVTHPWKCSMFTEGSLARLCANDPERFGKEKSECHEFIPPNNPEG